MEQVLPEGTVEVAETLTGKFTNRVRAGSHVLTADEPVAAGGTDTGPNPYEYLLAALGACTSMTMRMYAERKGIPAKQFFVRLQHARIHAKDCVDCEIKEGMISEITREIVIDGDVSAEDRQKLLEIAEKCPVHRTLTGVIKVRTKLVG